MEHDSYFKLFKFMLREYTFIDLFSGIGGFRLGLENCMFRCVWSCDNDKYANQVYERHFRCENHNPSDIRGVDEREIPDHDVLCAGFPCQSFSVAGKREGFQDTRGTLFFEICRITEAKKPSLLLLENVKGLLSHDKGFTFQVILESLEELGYWCEWQVLNSKHFGVPQNRERVFLVGHLGGRGTREVFPVAKAPQLSHRTAKSESESGEASSTIEASYGKGKSMSNLVSVGKLWKSGTAGRIHSPKGISQTVKKTSGYTEPLVMVEHKKITERSGEYGDGFKENEAFCLDSSSGRGQVLHIANAVDCDGYLRFGEQPRNKEGKPQLLPIGYRRIRRLTPVECERLQGFPDGWTEGVSDTQRYKLLGNAVTVNVIESLGWELRGCLDSINGS